MTLIKQPYFTRILETLDPNASAAFGNGHTHMGYFDDPQTRDVDAAAFAAATDELTRRILHVYPHTTPTYRGAANACRSTRLLARSKQEGGSAETG